MHKMSGYESRNVERSGNQKWQATFIVSPVSLLTCDTEFPPRDGAEHKARCFQYHALVTDKEKEAFLKQYGSQWTEFARLRYFDLVRFTLIDPMHNWLQGNVRPYLNCLRPHVAVGMAKWQWYEMFIKRKVLRPATATMSRELPILHEFLETARNILANINSFSYINSLSFHAVRITPVGG